MSRKITRQAVAAFMAGRAFSLDNTRVEQDGDHSYLMLHNSTIALLDKQSGAIEIATAGWNTRTTRERLNGIPGVHVYNKNRELYLNGVEWDGNWKNI